MFGQIATFLVDTVVTFIVFLLLARFLLQWLRVGFRNPVGESLRAAGPGVRCDHAAVPAPAAPLRAAGGKRRSDSADRPGHPAGAADSDRQPAPRRRRPLILELHVQPGASRSEFAGWHGERIRIRLAAPAVEGKANAALVEFLASYFGVPRRSVRIASGLKSRRKRVVIEGVSEWKPPTG